MSAYIIIHGTVTDEEKYEAYKKLTPASIEKYGGRFLIRGGEKSTLEGDWQVGRIVLLEFDSVERAQQWYDSPEYRQARAIREGGADMSFTIVEGC